MGKRILIVLLATLFVLGMAKAFAETQNIKVSGDLEFSTIFRNQYGLKNEGRETGVANPGRDKKTEKFFLGQARIRIDADLTDNVSATVRLLSEWIWGRQGEVFYNGGFTDYGDNSMAVDLDLAYVVLKEFLYSPLTLTIGRQELHFGNDMIVGDPDTNRFAHFSHMTRIPYDLTKRKSFDAIRATLDYNPLVVDVVMAQVREGGDTTTGAGGYIDDVDTLRADDDIRLLGINAKYDFGKWNTTGEAYFWQKHTGRKAYATNKNDTVNTVGGRIVTQPIENLTYQLEGAFQFGELNPGDITGAAYDGNRELSRRAWAVETFLTYDWKKAKYTPSATLGYAYFSGDRQDTYDNPTGGITPVTSRYRAWNPMFENQSFGRIANALMPQTNAHIIGISGSMKPREDITLKGEYYAYLWAKNYQNGALIPSYYDDPNTPASWQLLMTDKRFVGQEIDLSLTYDYTEDVQFKLMSDVFLPGAAFDKRNDDVATQVIGSMKVVF